MDALHSKLLLIAGQAVVVGILLDEAPGAHRLLAAVARETVLVPTVALVLHLLGAWKRGKREINNYIYCTVSQPQPITANGLMS